jgi:uncharacterized protein
VRIEGRAKVNLARGAGFCVAVVALAGTSTATAQDLKIMTGPPQSTQERMAAELAPLVAPFMNATLEVVPTPGPADSLQRLRDAARAGGGTNLAILQADVAYLYLSAASRGSADTARWLAPLRVIAPLNAESLHFLVRSDASYEDVRDIRNARINVGPANGGTALSVAALFRVLFDAPIMPDRLTRLSDQEALTKLLTDHSVDVVAVLADQPAPLLANMKPAAHRFVKLLKFAPEQTVGAEALRIYRAVALRHASYPNLLREDVPGLAVPLYLVAHDERKDGEDPRLAGLARGFCQALPRLKAKGTPQWQEVEAGLPDLAPGWHYAEMAALETISCPGVRVDTIPDVCQPQEKALGLCR